MSFIDIFIFFIIPRLVLVLIFVIATIHTIDALVSQNDGAHRVKIKKQP